MFHVPSPFGANAPLKALDVLDPDAAIVHEANLRLVYLRPVLVVLHWSLGSHGVLSSHAYVVDGSGRFKVVHPFYPLSGQETPHFPVEDLLALTRIVEGVGRRRK